MVQVSCFIEATVQVSVVLIFRVIKAQSRTLQNVQICVKGLRSLSGRASLQI